MGLKDAAIKALRKNRKALELASRFNSWLNLKRALHAVRTIEAERPGPIKGVFGVNVAGHITSESGVGEAARAEIRAIERAGVPFALNNLSGASRQNDRTFENFRDDNPYVFNLVHLNADHAQDFFMLKGPGYFRQRHSIGYWFWELGEFPPEWLNRFRFYDEIWAGSEFCASAFRKVSPVPVTKVPLSIELKGIKKMDRSRFSIGKDDFVFLFMFDFLSFFERKNPLAVIEAFRLAFGDKKGPLLLIKCSNSKWNIKARDGMMEASKGLNVKFLDDYLEKDELHSLVDMCDCYVSLHRSEGFGIPLAEAMYLGKPVIATGYSGNMEFMDKDNSFPVKYGMVEIERDFGPYKKGFSWAEPDTEDAAGKMRLVYEKREAAKAVGERAARHIRKNHDALLVGRIIEGRLRRIVEERGIRLIQQG